MRPLSLLCVLSLLLLGCPGDDPDDDSQADDDSQPDDDDSQADDDDDAADDDAADDDSGTGDDDDTVPDLPDFPRVLIVVERDESMAEHWAEDPAEPTRWEVVAGAIAAAADAAPPQMDFAVVGTDTLENHWLPISAFGRTPAELADDLSAVAADVQARTIASAYAYTLDNHVTNADPDPALLDWDAMPFVEPSTAIHAIVIGNGIGGLEDSGAANEIFVDDIYLCATPEEEADQTLLDDVAHYAINNDFNALHDGVQSVRTHTILVDAALTDAFADGFFWSTARTGSGTYSAVNQPSDMETAISDVVELAVEQYSTN